MHGQAHLAPARPPPAVTAAMRTRCSAGNKLESGEGGWGNTKDWMHSARRCHSKGVTADERRFHLNSCSAAWLRTGSIHYQRRQAHLDLQSAGSVQKMLGMNGSNCTEFLPKLQDKHNAGPVARLKIATHTSEQALDDWAMICSEIVLR